MCQFGKVTGEGDVMFVVITCCINYVEEFANHNVIGDVLTMKVLAGVFLQK